MRARMLASRGFQLAQQPGALVTHAMLERVDDAGIELATRRGEDASVGDRRRQRPYGGYAPLPHGPPGVPRLPAPGHRIQRLHRLGGGGAAARGAPRAPPLPGAATARPV